MPAVVIRFTGSAANQPGGSVQGRVSIGTISRDEFNTLSLVVDGGFEVRNHGPGPALVWMEVVSEFDVTAAPGSDPGLDLLTKPMVLDAHAIPEAIGVTVATDGLALFDRTIGKPYADVTFHWSAFAQRDTHDTATFTLRAASQDLVSGDIDPSFMGRVFSQRRALVAPGDRTYPEVP